jgi:glycosyltransferase involved in cell wall biosynthesis
MRKTLNLTLGIPMYNSARWLPNLLRSLRAQSILPSEIIFLDDASPDRSRDIAEDFMRENPEMNIQVRRNEKNLGIAGSYNALASLATTPWIQIMDADDFFPGEFFAFLEKHTVEDVVAIVTSMRSNITCHFAAQCIVRTANPNNIAKVPADAGKPGGTRRNNILVEATESAPVHRSAIRRLRFDSFLRISPTG